MYLDYSICVLNDSMIANNYKCKKSVSYTRLTNIVHLFVHSLITRVRFDVFDTVDIFKIRYFATSIDRK